MQRLIHIFTGRTKKTPTGTGWRFCYRCQKLKNSSQSPATAGCFSSLEELISTVKQNADNARQANHVATALLGRHMYLLLRCLPLALGAVTLAMLSFGHVLWAVALTMIAWGALNSAIPVAWSTWLSKEISDEPESGGGLIVAVIQLSIMLGAALGGLLLDHISIAATLFAGAILLGLASLTVGNGDRVRQRASD